MTPQEQQPGQEDGDRDPAEGLRVAGQHPRHQLALRLLLLHHLPPLGRRALHNNQLSPGD